MSSKVLLCHLDEGCMTYALRVATDLREENVACEVYPDVVKIKKQLDYANKKSIPYCIIIGSEEVSTGLLTLKNLETGEQSKINRENLSASLS